MGIAFSAAMLLPFTASLNSFLPWLDPASMFGSMFLMPPTEPRAVGGAVEVPSMTEVHEHYSLFVPQGIAPAGAPMVVMLHGASQDPADFAAGTAMNLAASRLGFVVLYPAQSSKANAHRCWSWFDARHQSRSDGEPARLAALTTHVAQRLGVNRKRVYVAGLSAGGAMAVLMGELFPELYAAVGVHSGLAPRVATDFSTALAAMRGEARPSAAPPSGVPTIVFHGDRDTTVHALNGEQVIDACVGTGGRFDSTMDVGPDGRRFTRRTYLRPDGRALAEHWILHGAGHAWSGGRIGGTFADTRGPDASGEMLRFFSKHVLVRNVEDDPGRRMVARAGASAHGAVYAGSAQHRRELGVQ
jgi:poly(hydroxyalkanoate) depolymerase family esterase